MKSLCREGKCLICGNTLGLTEHHLISGTANRRISTKFGLTTDLCPVCHDKAHRNRAYEYALKHYGQTVWESHYGTEEDFIKTFGKSWKHIPEDIKEEAEEVLWRILYE